MRRGLSTLGAFLLATACAAPGELEFTTQRLDFGAALPGNVHQKQVKLLNKGGRWLHLAETSSSNPAFELVFPTATFLKANESVMLTVRHVPPPGATEDQSATLRVKSDEGPEAAFEVSSVPTTPDCTLPDQLDFGPVRLRESPTLELVIRNPTALSAAAEVYPVMGLAGVFVSEHGSYSLSPGEESKVPITFVPTMTTDFAGSITLRPHQLCEPKRVALFGTGVTSVIAPSPTTLIFSIGLGTTQAQVVTLRNNALTPVTIFDVQTREGTAPSDVFRAVRLPLRIPAAERVPVSGELIPGEATLEVAFTPVAIRNYIGRLSFSTDLAAEPRVEVILDGSGR